MDIVEAIRLRKSIRGYKTDPVPKEVIREILDIASRSPSGHNSQPWEFTVVAGEVLDSMRRGNIEMLTSGAIPNPDVVIKSVEGIYKQRYVDLAADRFQFMGIARDDKEKRTEWAQRGFRYFDAPVAIILYSDSSLDEAFTQFDLGIVSQTICLAALSYGLGTCISRQAVTYPDVIREFTGIPNSKRIIIAIAMGYPDWDFLANTYTTQREPIDNLTLWCGF